MGISLPHQYDNPNRSKFFLQWIIDIKWTYPTGAFSIQSKLRILEILNKEHLKTGNEPKINILCKIMRYPLR